MILIPPENQEACKTAKDIVFCGYQILVFYKRKDSAGNMRGCVSFLFYIFLFLSS